MTQEELILQYLKLPVTPGHPILYEEIKKSLTPEALINVENLMMDNIMKNIISNYRGEGMNKEKLALDEEESITSIVIDDDLNLNLDIAKKQVIERILAHHNMPVMMKRILQSMSIQEILEVLHG